MLIVAGGIPWPQGGGIPCSLHNQIIFYVDCNTLIYTKNVQLMVSQSTRLMQVPKPWYRSYVTAKAAMQQDLFGTNPTMAAVLDLWYKTFG